MSDRGRVHRVRAAASALVWLACLTPLSLAAQDLAPDAARLKRQLSSAMRTVKLAKDSAEASAAWRARNIPPDSLRAGAIEIRFSAADLDASTRALLARAAARAWRDVQLQFGDAATRAAGTAPLIIRKQQYSSVGIQLAYLEVSFPGGRSESIPLPVTERKAAERIVDFVGTLASVQAPHEVMAWAGFWTPAKRLMASDWENASIDLASSSSSVTRGCYAGAVEQCASALGLSVIHDSLTEWYSADSWPALVNSWKPDSNNAALRADRRACLEQHVLSRCERLARQRSVPIPLGMQTRQALLGFAIEKGGDKAYTRFLGARGRPLEILATTAGVSGDSLLSAWRTRVRASTPSSVRPGALEASVLIAWTLVFAAASTRRRP